MLKSKPLATHRIFSCILLPSLIHPLLSVVNSERSPKWRKKRKSMHMWTHHFRRHWHDRQFHASVHISTHWILISLCLFKWTIQTLCRRTAILVLKLTKGEISLKCLRWLISTSRKSFLTQQGIHIYFAFINLLCVSLCSFPNTPGPKQYPSPQWKASLPVLQYRP